MRRNHRAVTARLTDGDVAGGRFGRLTVLRLAERRGRRAYVVAACDCGRQTDVLYASLYQGHTRSCGCLRAEKARQRLLAINADRINHPRRTGYRGQHSAGLPESESARLDEATRRLARMQW